MVKSEKSPPKKVVIDIDKRLNSAGQKEDEGKEGKDVKEDPDDIDNFPFLDLDNCQQMMTDADKLEEEGRAMKFRERVSSTDTIFFYEGKPKMSDSVFRQPGFVEFEAEEYSEYLLPISFEQAVEHVEKLEAVESATKKKKVNKKELDEDSKEEIRQIVDHVVSFTKNDYLLDKMPLRKKKVFLFQKLTPWYMYRYEH